MTSERKFTWLGIIGGALALGEAILAGVSGEAHPWLHALGIILAVVGVLAVVVMMGAFSE